MGAKKAVRPKTNRRTKRRKKPAVERSPDYKQKLLEIKKEILSQVPAASGKEAREGTSEVDDEAAVASHETSRDVFLLLTGRNRERLRAIEEALRKIEKKTFGVCEECEDKIEPARLRAMPLAKFCLDCQSQLEKDNRFEKQVGAGYRIPIEEDETEE